jgi:hypothetical protein
VIVQGWGRRRETRVGSQAGKVLSDLDAVHYFVRSGAIWPVTTWRKLSVVHITGLSRKTDRERSYGLLAGASS